MTLPPADIDVDQMLTEAIRLTEQHLHCALMFSNGCDILSANPENRPQKPDKEGVKHSKPGAQIFKEFSQGYIKDIFQFLTKDSPVPGHVRLASMQAAINSLGSVSKSAVKQNVRIDLIARKDIFSNPAALMDIANVYCDGAWSLYQDMNPTPSTLSSGKMKKPKG